MQLEDTVDLLDDEDLLDALPEDDDDFDSEDENDFDGEALFAEDDYDESDDDWEGWDDEGESIAERRRRRFPRYRRRRRGRSRVSRPMALHRVSRTRSATIRTPAGNARLRFPTSLAKASSVDARFRQVKGELTKLARSLSKVDKTLDKNTAMVDKKINALRSDTGKSLKKVKAQVQQAGILPLLLSSTPKFKNNAVTLQESGQAPTTFQVVGDAFAKDDSALPLILMMSGGFGGGSDSNSSMMMALLLSGAFK
ncbi:hypothetical protein [Halomonas sp. M20]|uniref:hypothetical protein n=1 Tax=Halomonas sp. M20 TaxID=2763264 RepID=UPI001D0B9CF8|nr:hypothetical protein [Halomonas sp. M20]